MNSRFATTGGGAIWEKVTPKSIDRAINLLSTKKIDPVALTTACACPVPDCFVMPLKSIEVHVAPKSLDFFPVPETTTPAAY